MKRGSTNEFNPGRLAFAFDRFPSKEAFTIIGKGVIIEPCVSYGKCCHFKSGSVIGQKGFSWAFTPELTPIPITHEGGVRIGNSVEIGALCTIARGTVEDTIIEDMVKIDDHVFIAHNCKIGEKSLIVAGARIGGSVVVGKKVWIGINATIQNGVEIGDYALIGSGANVIDNVPAGAVVAGNPAKILRYR